MPRVSLVVIVYEMARELPRTLLSLSPPYQDYDADDYEIIVIDNGSRTPPHQRDFAHLHANIRVLSCSTRSPSPVAAINEGLKLARGLLIGVWIDGARMASPRPFKGMHGSSRFAPTAGDRHTQLPARPRSAAHQQRARVRPNRGRLPPFIHRLAAGRLPSL